MVGQHGDGGRSALGKIPLSSVTVGGIGDEGETLFSPHMWWWDDVDFSG